MQEKRCGFDSQLGNCCYVLSSMLSQTESNWINWRKYSCRTNIFISGTYSLHMYVWLFYTSNIWSQIRIILISQIFHYISRYWSILYSCKKAEPLYGKSFSGDPFWISEMMDVRQGELVLSTPLCGVIKHSPRSYVQKPKEIYDTNHWPKSEFMARAISGKQPPSVEN